MLVSSLRTVRQNPSGARMTHAAISIHASRGGPIGRSAGTPAQIGRKSFGSARPRCESSSRQGDAGPAPASAASRRPHPLAPVAMLRSSTVTTALSAVGGNSTRRCKSPSVWPSWTLAPVTPAPSDMARASHARWKAIPHLPRSTGLGPVCSPPFLPAFSRRQGGGNPSRAIQFSS